MKTDLHTRWANSMERSSGPTPDTKPRPFARGVPVTSLEGQEKMLWGSTINVVGWLGGFQAYTPSGLLSAQRLKSRLPAPPLTFGMYAHKTLQLML